jgi:hypothetical protein
MLVNLKLMIKISVTFMGTYIRSPHALSSVMLQWYVVYTQSLIYYTQYT